LGAYQTGFTLTYYRELFKNTRRSLFYVPPIEALKNSLTVLTLIALLYAILIVIIAHKEGSYASLLDASVPLLLGFSAAIAQIFLLVHLRSAISPSTIFHL
jgi:thiamine transport system permease protein